MYKGLLLGLAATLLVGVAAAQQHRHQDGMASFSTDAKEAFTATPAFGADSTLWIARAGADRITVARSTDLGRSFGTPVSVTPGPINIDWGPDSRPQLAVDRSGALVVTWAIFQDKRFNGRVYYARSTDSGATFSAPQPITPDATSQRFQAVAIDPDGRLFAAWLDKRNVAPSLAAGRSYAGAALAYAWSDDGKSFADTHVAFDDTCECCRLALAFAGPGRPAVLFRNIFPGSIRDHAVVTFNDATTPGPLRRVSTDDWKIEACPHQGPSLAVAPDGSYHAAWFTDGAARHGLFYARADSDSAPFSEPRALSSPERHPSRPYLLATAKSLYLVWKEFDGTSTRVLAQDSQDSGRSWSAARTIARTDDLSDHPQLVADKGHAWLSWLTKKEGYRVIALEDAP